MPSRSTQKVCNHIALVERIKVYLECREYRLALSVLLRWTLYLNFTVTFLFFFSVCQTESVFKANEVCYFRKIQVETSDKICHLANHDLLPRGLLFAKGFWLHSLRLVDLAREIWFPHSNEAGLSESSSKVTKHKAVLRNSKSEVR